MIQETARSSLGAWESFYVIVGSSAAALTGLQFVVITLVSDARRKTGEQQIAAFSTPTVVHFCAALLVSVTVSAPWPDLVGPSVTIAICGVAGVVYSAIVSWRATRQTGYRLVAEDWAWHVVLPIAAYIAQVSGALALVGSPHGSLFVIAASALLLVFIGIHNAWDTTTWVAAHPDDDPTAPNDGAGSPAKAAVPNARVGAESR